MPRNNHIPQGWGIAFTRDLESNKPIFVVSDGTHNLEIIDAYIWTHIKQVSTELNYINELEMIPEHEDMPGISNYVFANAFHSNSIHMIHIHTGKIAASFDCSKLLQDQMSFV